MNERLDYLIEYLDLSKTEFAANIGKTMGTLSKYLYGPNKITKAFAVTITNHYPQISYEWLRFGRGDMLRSDIVSAARVAEEPKKGEIEKLRAEVISLKEKNKILNEKLLNAERRIKELEREKQSRKQEAISGIVSSLSKSVQSRSRNKN